MGAKQIVKLSLADVGLVTDKKSPIYDPRVDRALDADVVASFRVNGQQSPIGVVTRENLAAIGVAIDTPFTPIFGRGRRRYCEAAGIEFVEAMIFEVGSVSEFLSTALDENTHRDEEDLQSCIDKATRIYKAGGTLESISRSLRKPESTVRTLLKLGAEDKLAPEVKSMIANGELDIGSADQICGMPIADQAAVVKELEQVQVAQLAKGVNERGDAATITKNHKGETVVKPKQDTVQKAKAKVQEKAVPASVAKVEKKPPVDAALVEAKLGYVSLMRRLSDADQSYVAGFEAALCSLIGREPALTENAPFAALHNLVFRK